jgi:hypothetical protein
MHNGTQMPAPNESKAYHAAKVSAWRRHRTALARAERDLSWHEFEKCKLFLTEKYTQHRQSLRALHGVCMKPSHLIPTGSDGNIPRTTAGTAIAATSLVSLATQPMLSHPPPTLTMPLPTPPTPATIAVVARENQTTTAITSDTTTPPPATIAFVTREKQTTTTITSVTTTPPPVTNANAFGGIQPRDTTTAVITSDPKQMESNDQTRTTRTTNAPRRRGRSAPAMLRWATMGTGDMMTAGIGQVQQRHNRHVVLFAMHNLVCDTFRDSIRIQSLLRCTAVTHVSTMNQYRFDDCIGHNCVEFAKDRDVYPLLTLNCPRTIIWDYNFVPGGYVLKAYKGNLFCGQVPGYFACGAHMVVMPNWVLRKPLASTLDSNIVQWQTKDLLEGNGSPGNVSCTQGLAKIAPGCDVKQITLTATQAETQHPLVAATIAAQYLLHNSTDKNAAAASWHVNKRYIGEEVAFIVFYNAHKIDCPHLYLNSLAKHQ